MKAIEIFIKNIVIFQIVNDILSVTLGASLCFGALKWKKGLITMTAMYWGVILGSLAGILFALKFDSYILFFLCLITGGILFPVLTYTVAGVNRFVVGFLVTMKLTFMITTVMMKNGSLSISKTLILPLIAGIFVGFILMAWVQIRVSAFVLACSFVGASQIAPTIAKYINQIEYGINGGWLIDPYDLLFGLIGIELTDFWTLIILLIFMTLGIFYQLYTIKEQGYSFNTPLITYETDNMS